MGKYYLPIFAWIRSEIFELEHHLGITFHDLCGAGLGWFGLHLAKTRVYLGIQGYEGQFKAWPNT